MKIVNMSLLFLIIVGWLSSGCSNKKEIINRYEIIYMQVNNGINFDIYNLKEHHFSLEGKDYLKKRDANYGEFGGRMVFCNDAEYYCMVGNINAAIPKKPEGQNSWTILEWECSSQKPLSNELENNIQCEYKNSISNFVYDYKLGIISYFMPSSSGGSLEFRLMSEIGLLSPASEKNRSRAPNYHSQIQIRGASPESESRGQSRMALP